MTTFIELGLSKQIAARVESIGFIEPTEIQKATIPAIIAGRDVIGSAETGSGKTAAYVLPIIERLSRLHKSSCALVLVPTRELALQVKAEVDRFSPAGTLRSAAIYGGCGYGTQIKELSRKPRMIIATPGRLLDLIEQRYVNLAQVEHLVLDEADRLMDLGFMPQVRKVVDQIPRERNTLMFSATIDTRMEKLGREFLQNPIRVQVQHRRIEPASIEQRFHQIEESDKARLLLELLGDAGDGAILVFTRTRRRAKAVATRLRHANVEARELHGSISQSQRERTIEQYRQGRFSVLVATDIAARGLDIPTITRVVNYDLPQSAEDYVHRIGRTGRAGRSGSSHTFVIKDDTRMMRQIEQLIGRSLTERLASSVVAHRSVGRRRFKPSSHVSAR